MLVILALLLNGVAWASDTFVDSFFPHRAHQHDNDQSPGQMTNKTTKAWYHLVKKVKLSKLAVGPDGPADVDCGHHCHGGTHIVVGAISVSSHVAVSQARVYYTPNVFSHLSIRHTPPVPPPLRQV